MAQTPLLRVSNLEVVYHSVVLVLQGVSLDVHEGEVVALLGPNGAGKTTTMRAITGLLGIHDGRITKGDVQLDGAGVRGWPAERVVAAGVSQVMEGRRILADLSVEENLRAGGYRCSTVALRRGLHRAYTRFPILAERRKQAAGFLSGGEQQMLAIARALMVEPRLLLMDEPSLGLAPKIVAQVASLIRELNDDGVSVLLVEQNAAVALDLADRG